MKRFILPSLGGAVLVLMLPGLQAQTCSGNGDVVGAYGFAASRMFSAVPATAPGTNGSSNTGTGNTSTGTTSNSNFSNTDLGRFLGGVSGQTPFGTVGRLLADGAGNFFAATSATTTPQQVGTYKVYSDCTMTATFTDFTPSTTGSGSTGTGTAVTPASATLEGVVLNHGNDIELVQSGNSATGAVVEMHHTLQFNGCTAASLTGAFGVVSEATMASGTGATAGTPSAVPLFGRLVSNGDGTFSDVNTGAALPGRQLTGTYKVNADCTGTAMIKMSNGVTRNLNFVIVQSPAGACQSGGSVQPELLFGFTDSGVSGIGFSR